MKPGSLIIGCPVADRAWILPTWMDHVLTSLELAIDIIEVRFIFVVPALDHSTQQCIKDLEAEHGLKVTILLSSEEPRSDVREWGFERYEHMSALRNILLARVRSLHPTFYLSLDSDILLHRDSIARAISRLTSMEVNAVGMKLFMTPSGREAPSYGRLVNGGGWMTRGDFSSWSVVDVVMAAVLMDRLAYEMVDYEADTQGEDIGWSKNLKAVGLKAGWMGDGPINRHVMSPEALGVEDPRVGW